MIIINNNSTPPQMATTTMDYIKALEQERKKILVFEKELPLSLQIVTRAIETCKEQMGSEEVITSSEGPVLEEFMPLRPSSSSSEEEIHLRRDGNGGGGGDGKPDWLRSVQLWNQNPEPKRDVLRKPIAVNVKRIGGAFHPFGKEKVGKTVVDAPASSTTENNSGGGGGGRSGSQEEKDKEKEKEENSLRKGRRCWSPELHRRFLQALQQLGGSHAATPKQIRELMKVDGLTNDEVKSHLQKYRLHIRRPTTPPNQSRNNGSPQQPQIVLVGGLWMPAPLNSVFTPVSSLPSELDSENQTKQKNNNRSPTGPLNSDRRSNEGDGEGTNSESSATSSSSQTTTASPPLQDSANEE